MKTNFINYFSHPLSTREIVSGGGVLLIAMIAIGIGTASLLTLKGVHTGIFHSLGSIGHTGAWALIGSGTGVFGITAFYILPRLIFAHRKKPSFPKEITNQQVFPPTASNTDPKPILSKTTKADPLPTTPEPCSPKKKEHLRQLTQQILEKIDNCLPSLKSFSKTQRTVIALYILNYSYQLLHTEQDIGVFDEGAHDSFMDRFCEACTSQKADIFSLSKLNDYPLLCADEIRDVIKSSAKLTVEVSEDEILEAYITYNRLILLRPLKSDVLMLGCGWGRCRFEEKGQSEHFTHADVDTVNVRLNFNPSVICFWGDPSQCLYFQNRYSLIYDEGPIVGFIENKKSFYQCCISSFQKNHENARVVVKTDKPSEYPDLNAFELLSNVKPPHVYSYADCAGVYRWKKGTKIY